MNNVRHVETIQFIHPVKVGRREFTYIRPDDHIDVTIEGIFVRMALKGSRPAETTVFNAKCWWLKDSPEVARKGPAQVEVEAETEPDETVAPYLAMSVKEAKEAATTVDDETAISWLHAESRKTVRAALEKRLEELRAA